MAMASLTASLLARKGEAKPSLMRPPFNVQKHSAINAAKPLQQTPRKREGKSETYTSNTYTSGNNSQNDHSIIEQKDLPKFKEPKQTSQGKPSNHKSAKTAAKVKPREKTKTQRKSISLPHITDQRLKIAAAHLGVSQRAVVQMALETYLDDYLKNSGCICGGQKPND